MKKLPPPELVDITKCVRCGKNHKRLAFSTFKKKPISEYKYWALCPKTKEPLLMAPVSVLDPRLDKLRANGTTVVRSKT
jgi:hypothetical protein